jgi:glycosyltransferase involved in cell wall biosynthesis
VNSPDISVLIASRNRKEAMAKLLDCMEAVVKNIHCEIIVADNGTFDQTAELLKNYGHRLPLKAIYVPEQGKSRALNRVIAEASGELLVFADDDIRPEQNWLQAYRQAAAERPDINVFAGRILVDRGSVPAWIAQSYNLQTILLTEQDLGGQARQYGFDEYPVGPNIAVRKKLLKSLYHPWPEDVGPGTRLPVGDEVLFLRKLSSPSAADRLYVPDSIVYHAFNPANLGFITALRRCYQGGYAAGLHGTSTRRVAHGKQSGITVKVRDRVRTCRSLRELMCMISRAAGFYTGSLRALRVPSA